MVHKPGLVVDVKGWVSNIRVVCAKMKWIIGSSQASATWSQDNLASKLVSCTCPLMSWCHEIGNKTPYSLAFFLLSPYSWFFLLTATALFLVAESDCFLSLSFSTNNLGHSRHSRKKTQVNKNTFLMALQKEPCVTTGRFLKGHSNRSVVGPWLQKPGIQDEETAGKFMQGNMAAAKKPSRPDMCTFTNAGSYVVYLHAWSNF